MTQHTRDISSPLKPLDSLTYLLLTFPTAGRWQRDVLHLEEGLHVVTVVFADLGRSLRPVYLDIFRGHFTKAHNKQNKTDDIFPGIHRALCRVFQYINRAAPQAARTTPPLAAHWKILPEKPPSLVWTEIAAPAHFWSARTSSGRRWQHVSLYFRK